MDKKNERLYNRESVSIEKINKTIEDIEVIYQNISDETFAKEGLTLAIGELNDSIIFLEQERQSKRGTVGSKDILYLSDEYETLTLENNIIDMKIDVNKIDRLEIINHAKNDKAIGRLLTLYKELKDFKSLEFSVQDDGKTLKIFLN